MTLRALRALQSADVILFDALVSPGVLDFARREAKRRGGFLIRAEPNIVQDDPVWPDTLKRLCFRPTSHTIYLRGAWVTDLRPSEDQLLAAMMTTWRQNIRADSLRPGPRHHRSTCR